MYWILAAVFVVITLAVPRLRPLGIGGLVILAALLTWGMLQRMRGGPQAPDASPQRGQPTSPATMLSAVPLELVRLENMQLTGGGAPFELRGVIENRANDLQLRSVTIEVARRDCYPGALDPTGCVLVWQDRHWLPMTVPPLERREFANAIWMRGSAPRPRGEIKDSFSLVAATGEAVQREERRD